jgi:hypothetical protein
MSRYYCVGIRRRKPGFCVMRHDFAFYLMNSAVTIWMVGAACLVWAWPCVLRLVTHQTPRGVFGLVLPRGASFFMIIVNLLMIMMHIVAAEGRTNFSTLICLSGLAATLWMRSAMRRQVSG